jgi:beta-glucanase (GH16 family)
MMTLLRITTSILPALLFAACAGATEPPAQTAMPTELAPPQGYALVWSDDFEKPGLPDPARWDYDTARNREGWYNEEAQYYSRARAQNSRVENGLLVIEARREDFGSRKPADFGGQKYTSTRLVTAGKAGWTYAFIEVRAKLPCGRGVWPAIWMLPDGPGAQWPHGGEIDIMEHVGHDQGRVHATIHTGAYGHGSGNDRNVSVIVPDACTAFHNYQLLWTKGALTIGIDGKAHFHFPNDGRGYRATWPFDRPFHLLLNIAIGGTWGGQHGIDDAVFPVRMEVDYVRVYQQH